MPDTEVIVQPGIATVSVALEPVFNAMSSLRLLTWGKEHALDPWVERTLAAMTPEQFYMHRVVMLGLYYVVNPQQSFRSFPAYIDHLAATSPIDLRNKMLDTYLDMACMGVDCDESGKHKKVDYVPTREELIASKEYYIGFLGSAFPGPGFDPAIESEAYDLIMDLPRMQVTLVNYLRMIWDEYLEEEWLRVRPMLQESVDAFRQVNLSEMDRIEAARYVIGQAQDKRLCKRFEEYERVVFVPSPHIGEYQATFFNETTLWLTFGARLPSGMVSGASALSRAELLVRLNTLADDTRLRILALIAAEGEHCAQHIISTLDLSQSAASRHLKQLSATGFLTESRRENAKCYHLNMERVDDTLAALKQFLS